MEKETPDELLGLRFTIIIDVLCLAAYLFIFFKIYLFIFLIKKIWNNNNEINDVVFLSLSLSEKPVTVGKGGREKMGVLGTA